MLVVASGRVVLGHGRCHQLNTALRYLDERGGGPRKIRVIDDVRASGANSVTATHDTAVPDSLDCLLSLAVCYRLLSPGCLLKAAPADFSHAYNTIGRPSRRERFPPCC